MKPKTEELLYLLLWAAEVAARPTLRNLTDSFESWAYRKRFRRRLKTLEQQKLLETKLESDGTRLHRLTEAGVLLACGPHDPLACWSRRWDGKWRMVLFDVPQSKATQRARLRRWLVERGFGYLQNSVWITPDPLTAERQALRTDSVDVESLILLEARPCAGESNAEIVAGAWDFAALNKSYDRHARVLEGLPRQSVASEAAARQLHRWLRDERLAWSETMRLDPLLPKSLHPPDYPGVKAWTRRLKVMAEAGQYMRGFRIAG